MKKPIALENISVHNVKIRTSKSDENKIPQVNKIVLETDDKPTGKITYNPTVKETKKEKYHTNVGVAHTETEEKRQKTLDELNEKFISLQQELVDGKKAVLQLDVSEFQPDDSDQSYYFIRESSIEDLELVKFIDASENQEQEKEKEETVF